MVDAITSNQSVLPIKTVIVLVMTGMAIAKGPMTTLQTITRATTDGMTQVAHALALMIRREMAMTAPALAALTVTGTTHIVDHLHAIMSAVMSDHFATAQIVMMATIRATSHAGKMEPTRKTHAGGINLGNDAITGRMSAANAMHHIIRHIRRNLKAITSALIATMTHRAASILPAGQHAVNIMVTRQHTKRWKSIM
jgi:hypothetical protein